METELTKEMKRAIREYKPALKSSMRTIRYAEEVNVGTGFVDSIRFEDYIGEDKSFCKRDVCKYENEDTSINEKKCHGCFHKYNEHVLGMLITCFEMKISKSDFKSKHGHNFVGNKNYYVIPKDLYEKVKDLVPEGIGIILYYGNSLLRTKKECEFKKIDDKTLGRLLFNALKKWVDEGRRDKNEVNNRK